MPLYISRIKQFDPWLTQKPDLNTKVRYSLTWTASGPCFGRVHKSFFTKKPRVNPIEKAVTAAALLDQVELRQEGELCSCLPSLCLSTHLKSSTPFACPKPHFHLPENINTRSKLKSCQQGKQHKSYFSLLVSQWSDSSPLRAWMLWKSWKSHSPAHWGK